MLIHEEHVRPYEHLYKLEEDHGYIVWRYGTGETIELLQLATTSHREGYGTYLIRKMLTKILRASIPFTIYGFTRERMIHAQMFYIAVGFKLIRIPNYYREGSAVMFSQSLSYLLKLHQIEIPNASNEDLIS